MVCSLIDNSIMKILYILFSMNLYLSYVSSRALHAAGIKLVGSEPKAELQIKLKPKKEDNIIWTKVETKSALAIPSSHDGNNSSREEKFISKTFASLKHQEKEDSEAVAIKTENWIKNREPLGKESLFPGNKSVHDPMGFLGNHSQDNSNSSEFSDALVTGNLFSSLLSEWDSENISDVVTFGFDDGNESTIAKMLIESVQPLEQITSNGTFIITEDDVNLFQEVSTFGFEFLIDSETTRNSFISDLLISQNNSITDDLDDELATLLKDWEQSTLESENFGADNSSLDEETIILLSSKNEIENLVSEKRNMRDLNFTGSEQNTITERITPVCPEAGWCFFWLFAEDTCAKDHHCLGSRICCKLGCVKTCVDV